MKDLDFCVLVNKENPLKENYIPNCLYVVDENENNFHKYKDPSLKPMLRSDIKPYVDELIAAALKNGFEIIVDSGYRSYEYQKIVLEKLIIDKGIDAYNWVALPGTSEHQTGLAFDMAYFRNGLYCDDVLEEDEEAKWMYLNSYKYGFILRYPKGKETITGYKFEPWHFRFVGLDLAQNLYLENLTLEEYYERKRIRTK